eukprot:scpid62033/ scgid17287/ 
MVICPKELLCSAKTVRTAVYLSVLLFNSGYQQIGGLLKEMQCLPAPTHQQPWENWTARNSTIAPERALRRRRKPGKGAGPRRKDLLTLLWRKKVVLMEQANLGCDFDYYMLSLF